MHIPLSVFNLQETYSAVPALFLTGAMKCACRKLYTSTNLAT